MWAYDFYYLYAAGFLNLHAISPYNLAAFQSSLAAIGWPASEWPQPFMHPPQILWLYSLMALLPFAAARACWSGLQLIILFVAAMLLKRMFRQTIPDVDWLLALILFPPVTFELYRGQSNFLVLAGILFCLNQRDRNKYFSAGVALSLCLIKFHAVIAVLSYFFVSDLRRREYAMQCGLVSGFLIQLGLSCLINPDCMQGFRQAIADSHPYLGASLISQLVYFSGHQFWGWIGLSVSALSGAIIAVAGDRSSEKLSVLLILIPLSLLLSPYLWSHSFMLLWPAFALVSKNVLLSKKWRLLMASVVLPLGLLSLMWPPSESSWSVIAAILAFFSLRFYRQRSGRMPSDSRVSQ